MVFTIVLFANEKDGSVHRISRPGSDCDSDRGNKQVGLVYSRDVLFPCVFQMEKKQTTFSLGTSEKLRPKKSGARRMGVLVFTDRTAPG